MKLQIILSSISILLLIGAILLGVMVLGGKTSAHIHMMVALLGAMLSIATHGIFLGRLLKKEQ